MEGKKRKCIANMIDKQFYRAENATEVQRRVCVFFSSTSIFHCKHFCLAHLMKTAALFWAGNTHLKRNAELAKTRKRTRRG